MSLLIRRTRELSPRVARALPPEQLSLALDWGREPWEGVSPRYLTKGSCIVDNSVVGCPSREALESYVDPRQLTAFLKGTSYGS